MNGHMRAHGKHMAIGGAAVVALMIVGGVSWQQAVTWGLLLACPLGMLGMMWFMGRHATGRQAHGGDVGADHGVHAAEVPPQRVSVRESFATEPPPGA